MSTVSIISTWQNQLKTKLVSEYDRMGLRASGEYAESLEWKNTFLPGGGVSMKLFAAKHAINMQLGRKPDESPSVDKAKSLYPIILQWIEDKSLTPDNKKQFAFRTALSIIYSGIKVPNRFNEGGVLSNVINDRSLKELIDELVPEIIKPMEIKIKKAWQQ